MLSAPGMRGDQRADAGDARGDQHDVGHRAHRDDRQHVLAADALTQHERVLGADRDDQRERGEEADEQGRAHALTLGYRQCISTANDSSSCISIANVTGSTVSSWRPWRAVVEHGSFDAAAARLHVTPSAVSQRIKALEQRVGQVLVVREKPCVATAAGVPLLRLAAQTALLESEALAEMGGGDGAACRGSRWPSTPIRWRRGSPGSSTELPDVLFDIRIEDQDHSARLLREGVVMGAVTTERTPVPGCRVQPLGRDALSAGGQPRRMSSVICLTGSRASGGRCARHWLGIATTRCRTCWCARSFRRAISRPTHFVPTAEGFGSAVRAGPGLGHVSRAARRC